MFEVDWGMSLRQLVARTPQIEVSWFLQDCQTLKDTQKTPPDRRALNASPLSTTSRSTSSEGFRGDALHPVLLALVCFTANTNGAGANPTRPPRVLISRERTTHQVGRQQEPAQSQLGDRDSRPGAACTWSTSPSLPTTPAGAPALPGCPLVLPRAMAGFLGVRGAGGRSRGGVGGLWAKGQGRVLALLLQPKGVNPIHGAWYYL